MSGDSDYIELVRHLKSEGVRVEIAAVLKTTSQLLKDEADHYHEIPRKTGLLCRQRKLKGEEGKQVKLIFYLDCNNDAQCIKPDRC